MSILYLHIGTSKTGTTAIQHFLWDNKEMLGKNKYVYPCFDMSFEGRSPKRNGHFLMDRLYNEEMAATEKYQKDIELCYKKVFDELDSQNNVILSEESIWHACKKLENFWEDLYEKVTKRGHQLKVVVFLRRQDEFIQSYWKFNVLDKGTRSFKEYVDQGRYKFFPLNYYSHLNFIGNVIGKENIAVRVYEKERYKEDGNAVISDFLSAVGLELTDEYNIEEKFANNNVDLICTEFKRNLNKLPDFQGRKGNIRKYMAVLSEKNKEEGKYQFKSLFMPEEQKKFLKKYEKSNSMVAREWLGREDGVLFRYPISYDDREKVFSAEDYIIMGGRLISLINKDIKKLKADMEQSD